MIHCQREQDKKFQLSSIQLSVSFILTQTHITVSYLAEGNGVLVRCSHLCSITVTADVETLLSSNMLKVLSDVFQCLRLYSLRHSSVTLLRVWLQHELKSRRGGAFRSFELTCSDLSFLFSVHFIVVFNLKTLALSWAWTSRSTVYMISIFTHSGAVEVKRDLSANFLGV